MTLATRVIASMRSEHDDLAKLAADLTPEQLDSPSGASEWSVADVLSHLGSGSEINRATLQAALGERPAPDSAFNHSVWDRWNAMSPIEQRDSYLEHGLSLVETYEALTEEQRASLLVPLGYLPAPLPVAGLAGMRLSEQAHHGWDIRVALDPSASLDDATAALLAECLSSELAFPVGFMGKADRLDRPVVLGLGDSGYELFIDDSVSLRPASGAATASLSGPLEGALRLTSGRLGPAYTPAEVTVTGNVTLDELRQVFPGL